MLNINFLFNNFIRNKLIFHIFNFFSYDDDDGRLNLLWKYKLRKKISYLLFSMPFCIGTLNKQPQNCVYAYIIDIVIFLLFQYAQHFQKHEHICVY